MNAGMVEQWIERIRKIAPELGISRVEGLAQYVEDDLETQRLPAIWVLPTSHEVIHTPPTETEKWEYAVIIGLRSARQGQRDSELLCNVLLIGEMLREHLEKWSVARGCGLEIQYLRGEGAGLTDDGSVFFWQQTYSEITQRVSG